MYVVTISWLFFFSVFKDACDGLFIATADVVSKNKPWPMMGKLYSGTGSSIRLFQINYHEFFDNAVSICCDRSVKCGAKYFLK